MVLVVLHPDRPADVWNLGDWRIEDVRPDAVLLSRSGGDGLELGIIHAV